MILAGESLPAPITQGLDPLDRRDVARAFHTFCREILDVVAPLVPAVKPQMAFFEQLGPPGLEVLAAVVDELRDNAI